MARSIPLVLHPQHSIEAQVDNKRLTVFIRGNINEDVNFGSFFKMLHDLQLAEQLTTIAFNLASILRINSCGVREWMLFVERVQSIRPIRFVSVNEIFLSQASMVPNMLGKIGTPIDEFEAPYFCSRCSVRELVLFGPGEIKEKDGELVAPQVKCTKCQTELEFDALPSEYFSFIKRLQKSR